MSKPYGPIRDTLLHKVRRAETHKKELNTAWDAFLEKDPYPVKFRDDPTTGDRIYYLASVRDVPEEFALIVGDSIHNLRSSLDHLAHRLVAIHGKGETKIKVDFPIAATFERYKSRRAKLIGSISRQAMYEIDRLEPWGTGHGKRLWLLHHLDIIDKHKLILTVGSANFAQSASLSERTRFAKDFLGTFPSIPGTRDLFIGSPNCFPLKAGDILAIRPKSEVEEDMHFPFEIAFAQPETAEGKSVERTLGEMAHFIRDLFKRFEDKGLLG
jgi:hypothetical protein